MPILHLGTINNNGQQLATTVNKALPQTIGWVNDKGSGDAYTEQDLLDDILTPFESQIIPDSTSYNVVGHNEIINKIITMFKTSSSFEKLRNNWFEKWKIAFQKNPTIDLSSKISKYIGTMLAKKGSTPGAAGWLDDAFLAGNGNQFILDKAQNEISTFMNNLPGTIDEFLDQDLIKNKIDLVIDDVLKNFNLNRNDASNFSEVDEFIKLKDNALQNLESKFEASTRLTNDRPYRKLDKKIENQNLQEYFGNEYFKSEWVDNLSDASLKKAINGTDGLAAIMNFDPNTHPLDSRVAKVMQDIKTLNLSVIPEEITKLVFGSEYQKFTNWYNKWKNLFNITFDETFDDKTNTAKINVHLEIIDKIVAMNTDKGILKIDKAERNSANKEILEKTISTTDLPTNSIIYSTTMLVEKYKAIIEKITSTSFINEDDYLSLLKKYNLKVGDTINSATVEDLEKLNPTIFGAKNKTLTDVISEINSEIIKTLKNDFGINYKPMLKVLFTISYDDKDGAKVKIMPHFSDLSIKNLPTINWLPSSSTSPDEQNKINQLFKSVDAKYADITHYDDIDAEENIVSPLETAAADLFNLFESETQGKNTVQKIDFIGNLKVGETISVSELEKLFGNLKNDFDKFLSDRKNRFTVNFIINDISDKQAVIEYEITDTKTGHKTKVINDVSKIKLNNITVKFSNDLDKAQTWLDTLKKSPVVIIDDFKSKSSIDQFSKSSMEIDDKKLNIIFPKLAEIINSANKDNVVIVPQKKIINENGILFQVFEATYTSANGAKISHSIKIAISTNYASEEQKQKASEEIGNQAEEARSVVDDADIEPKDVEKIKAEITKKEEELKRKITDDKEQTPEKLEGIIGESSLLKQTAAEKALEAKNNMLEDKLKGMFPEGIIPAEVKKLFKEHIDGFENVMKNHPELLKNVKNLKDFFANVNSLDLKAIANAQRTMQKGTKIALASLGGMLGAGFVLGGANSIKVATTNKKIKASNSSNGKIKSSKKLAIISALIGLMSAAGSIGTFIYLFIVQGGL